MVEEIGVQIWSYATQQRVTFDDDATDSEVIQANANTMVDTIHRRNARRLSSEALRRKVEQGYVGGGTVYGYKNTEVKSGHKRDHVIREIVPEQANVIRRIFTLSADGWGLLKIAKALNAERIPSPTGRGWASTGVREMLHRDLYRGRIVYGRTRWRRKGERKRKIDVPEAQWLRVDAPELRIVSNDLWHRVHERQARARETYPGRNLAGQLQGRRESGLLSQYLLSGFLRCACGRNLIVIARSGRGGVKKYWVCTRAHHRGKEICANVQGIPYEPLTQAVVETFRTNFFNPFALGQVLIRQLEQQAVAPEAAKAEAEAMRREIAKLDRETARLVAAVAGGEGDVAPLAEVQGAAEGRSPGQAGALGRTPAGGCVVRCGRVDGGDGGVNGRHAESFGG